MSYRLFEILPGALAWLTLVLVVVFSSRLPAFVAVFIILFDIYWLLKTVYLSLHLRSTFSAMRANLKIDWARRLKELSRVGPPTPDQSVGASELHWQDVYHLIILPMYREPYEVVRESFESLVRVNYPKDKLLVVLATEEAAGEHAKFVAQKIKGEFGGKFFRFLVTTHPMGLPGEISGKGANETWAAKEAKRLIIDPLVNTQTNVYNLQRKSALSQRKSALRYENILVSVFDIDTQVFPEYFGRLSYVFLTSENRERAIYQPIPLFTNNVYKASAFARVVSFSATFWQMMQQSRPERLTSFSSQSIPFNVLVDIGFWQKDIVSEDSRIFWQCYLHYHGDFSVKPLLYPVSMDANVAPTFWGTVKNIYRQQRRWGWGCENIPYMLDGFRKDDKIPAKKKWYWTFNVIEGFHSWATNSLMIFALGWLPVVLGGRLFNYTLLSYGLPQVTRFIISLSMIGIASSAVLGILLLPPRPKWFRARHYLIYFFQWLLIPLTLTVFGALPGLEAQTRLALGGRFRLGFWVTPKTRGQ
jgi:cellulose synthase/poly-beta-1,6-N-acetylglucosamine synthase-like glycosyltransferase